ncbi:MAG: hypothetical protein PHN19_00415 [Patescibacteria group bacterium]|nr:hypothetical protein [Patescibacteria group bacterium]
MPAKKASEKPANGQDPGSKTAGCTSGKKMMVLLMECEVKRCRALLKALEDAGFDVYVCNDLSSCMHVLKAGYTLGFALIAPTIDGRDGYMKIISLHCQEQEIPLEIIDDNTVYKISRFGLHFPQQIAPQSIAH